MSFRRYRSLGFLLICLAGVILLFAAQSPAGAVFADSSAPVWRVNGRDIPSLAAFDVTLKSYMQKRSIHAGALAVTYQGRLVMAHGYTWDDPSSAPVTPASLFRIASLSKSITAAAILKLVEDKKLALDNRVSDILNFSPPPGESLDPRIKQVTIYQLLTHRGGWDIEQLGFDPMFSDQRIADALGVPLPITQADILTYMSGIPLSTDPGSAYTYSNFGYFLLGRVIETVSRQSYETYVRQNILLPLGIRHMAIGQSLPQKRLPGEVPYLSQGYGPTVFDSSGDQVPWPDGAWNLANMDSHGGWVTSVVEMARFSASFDQPARHPVLSQASIKQMFALPPGDKTAPGDAYYAMGWQVRAYANHTMNTWHTGSLDGTYTLMVRRSDGAGWVVFFNQRADEKDPNGETYGEIDGLLHQAADQVKTWPKEDLFGEFE